MYTNFYILFAIYAEGIFKRVYPRVAIESGNNKHLKKRLTFWVVSVDAIWNPYNLNFYE